MKALNSLIAGFLILFTLWEVNYPLLQPQSDLAIFAMAGLVLCFLNFPTRKKWRDKKWSRVLDGILAVLAVATCGFILSQTEPAFRSLWIGDQPLGNRPGQETAVDIAVAIVLLILVLESARRCMGWALPILAMLFLAYALAGPNLPNWLIPHRGYDLERTVAQTVLHGQGVFGVALGVMFRYVFLFVVFGAFLSATGATGFIIEFARRIFRNSVGAPAKVAVVSSGFMGSLSGSAVANVVTTGTFTIPMMRASGFKREIAGGIEAASSSGGALVPPVMGAAAYLMLEIVQPSVTYLQIIQSALIPAILYYLSLFLFVHFHSLRIASAPPGTKASSEEDDDDSDIALPNDGEPVRLETYKGVLFAGSLASLITFLCLGFTPFRAVTLALVVLIALSFFRPETRLTWPKFVEAIRGAGKDVVPLICASACVGLIIGVVTLTGVGTRFPAMILPIAENNLLGALFLIMIGSLILGMGLPSVVCYLLMATLVGPVLGNLGVVPLAAHFFIFYFGMMSMVTPPVALAAYAASSVAGSKIIPTSMAAFRVALVGFTLPFMFVFRPELLLLAPNGKSPAVILVIYATTVAGLGILAFASALSGYLLVRLKVLSRVLLFVAAALMLYPGDAMLFPKEWIITVHDLAGVVLLVVVALVTRMKGRGVVVDGAV
ncbi:MAG: TRAP transporter fused permease subunit [Verrucomicrobiales bacterium]|nr:TRAP transporter fused permease subunit [Verrucomicrobiales bacterium]